MRKIEFIPVPSEGQPEPKKNITHLKAEVTEVPSESMHPSVTAALRRILTKSASSILGLIAR